MGVKADVEVEDNCCLTLLDGFVKICKVFSRLMLRKPVMEMHFYADLRKCGREK